MRQASARQRAHAQLVALQASFAAFGAVMAKGGARNFERMQKELKRIIET